MGTLISDIRRILLDNDDFVIASHINPDSDAVGSCLALGLSLKKLGKRVNVLLEPFHKKNTIIPGQELIYKGGEPPASVFIVLDCANADRVGDPFSIIKRAPVTVSIDHHHSHAPFTQLVYLLPEASSTCEMVYNVISPMLDLDPDIASAIYAGLLTDTGGFRHNCTSAAAMCAASELIKTGIPFTDIYNELLLKHSITETAVLRFALNNLELLGNDRAAFAYISSEEMYDIGAEATDTDGISEYLLNISGVEISAFLYEKVKGAVKASLRSLAINVSDIAKVFGGGGHVHAAGCTIRAALPDAYRELSYVVRGALETL